MPLGPPNTDSPCAKIVAPDQGCSLTPNKWYKEYNTAVLKAADCLVTEGEELYKKCDRTCKFTDRNSTREDKESEACKQCMAGVCDGAYGAMIDCTTCVNRTGMTAKRMQAECGGCSQVKLSPTAMSAAGPKDVTHPAPCSAFAPCSRKWNTAADYRKGVTQGLSGHAVGDVNADACRKCLGAYNGKALDKDAMHMCGGCLTPQEIEGSKVRVGRSFSDLQITLISLGSICAALFLAIAITSIVYLTRK